MSVASWIQVRQAQIIVMIKEQEAWLTHLRFLPKYRMSRAAVCKLNAKVEWTCLTRVDQTALSLEREAWAISSQGGRQLGISGLTGENRQTKLMKISVLERPADQSGSNLRAGTVCLKRW